MVSVAAACRLRVAKQLVSLSAVVYNMNACGSGTVLLGALATTAPTSGKSHETQTF